MITHLLHLLIYFIFYISPTPYPQLAIALARVHLPQGAASARIFCRLLCFPISFSLLNNTLFTFLHFPFFFFFPRTGIWSKKTEKQKNRKTENRKTLLAYFFFFYEECVPRPKCPFRHRFLNHSAPMVTHVKNVTNVTVKNEIQSHIEVFRPYS